MLLPKKSIACAILFCGMLAIAPGIFPAGSSPAYGEDARGFTGMTNSPEGKASRVVADESVPPCFAKQAKPIIQSERFQPNRPEISKMLISWVLKDTLLLSFQIPSLSWAAFSNNPATDTLEAVFLPDTLTILAQQAVDYAPDWLEAELTDNFRRLPGSFQDTYANLILNSSAKYADEIAFQIARLGAETLVDSTFDPNLILVNAQYLYQNDDSLDYVEIVDYGAPPGGNYYSTVVYKAVENGDTLAGDTVSYELPKEYYYMYIVHPQNSDESPRMDALVYNRFWRDYLFNYADPGYPLLRGKIRQARVLWHSRKYVLPPGRSFDPWDSALDILGNWTSEILPVMAEGNRPIQPNTIAHEHNGNCGELQDLISAAGRAALIPFVSTMNYAEDHVWSEFYYKGWHEFQVDRGYGVTHIDDPSTSYDYDVGGSKSVSSIWNWRSDGYGWTVTGAHGYSNACSLHVAVCDARGLPVDGARVYLWTESFYGGGYDITTWGFTNSQGYCDFELGNLRNFYVSIKSSVANYPSDNPGQIVKIVSYSQTGADYYKTFYLSKFITIPRAEAFDTTGTPTYLFECEFNSPYELLHGYVRARRDDQDALPYNHTYIERNTPGKISFYICDSANYSLYLQNKPFKANWIGRDISADAPSFAAPYSGRWYLLFSNANGITTTEGLDLKLRLYYNAKSGVAGGPGNREQIFVFRLWQNAPNPFSRATTIKYQIPKEGNVSLKIYNIAGQVVKVLLDEETSPSAPSPNALGEGGVRSVTWDGKDESSHLVSAGVYICRLNANGQTQTQKMIMIK
ncbi:T9SS type A sorting domain-containing protein [candidate division TA06 bacterium]|uniref:T9SS type A sorting domain-containing protein n=1 Tax=candidate division TA06 bacterium TaxID=2250710 RepID=A0A933I8M1_UNCT6|nr:T9SS type A sorting domain-containing protein [candidate division TA06 bacterium]